MTAAREGVTLPELILVSWLFALVLVGVARFAQAQGALAATTHDRLRAADLVRTVDLVLGSELRGLSRSDATVGGDSIRLRAVRGSGVICESRGSAVTVRYEGLRWPDPEKDSVLILSHDSAQGRHFAVLDASSGDTAGCAPGVRLVLDPEPPPAGLVLVFETGSYHLASGALRYRRGRGGRQPVTEGLLEAGSFERRDGAVRARLSLHADSLPRLDPGRLHPVVRVRTHADPDPSPPTRP